MNKEAYVSLETAQLLKEKGFDWELRTYYNEDGDELRLSDDFADISNPEIDTCGTDYIDYLDIHCTRPTQQMACRWLREEKGIHIYPIPVTGFYYVVSVYAEEGNKIYDRIMSRSGRHAYEDTVETALEFVLTKLI